MVLLTSRAFKPATAGVLKPPFITTQPPDLTSSKGFFSVVKSGHKREIMHYVDAFDNTADRRLYSLNAREKQAIFSLRNVIIDAKYLKSPCPYHTSICDLLLKILPKDTWFVFALQDGKMHLIESNTDLLYNKVAGEWIQL